MSDSETAPVGGAETIAPIQPPAPVEVPERLTVREATDLLHKSRNPEPAPDEAAAPIQDGAAETPPSGTAEGADAVEETLPPIDPPRSWSKEDKEIFASLPRETQERTAERERLRETDFSRRQNEAAEQRKAAEAERTKAEQARQQYEQALPALLQTLQTAQSGEFADIKTQEDVNKLASEDWPRFARYQAHLMQVGSLEREVKVAQERQAQEQRSQWTQFASKEDQMLLDKAPELSDRATMEKTSKAALKTLTDIGFDEQELAKAWNGEIAISPRDHRFQILAYEASKYREAKANASKAPVKIVPPVQRPGTATTKGDTSASQLDALKGKLKTARGMEATRIATDIMRLNRAARG